MLRIYFILISMLVLNALVLGLFLPFLISGTTELVCFGGLMIVLLPVINYYTMLYTTNHYKRIRK